MFTHQPREENAKRPSECLHVKYLKLGHKLVFILKIVKNTNSNSTSRPRESIREMSRIINNYLLRKQVRELREYSYLQVIVPTQK